MPLPRPIFLDSIPVITKLVQDLFSGGFISPKQKLYLTPVEGTCQGRTFYILPKVHKERVDWPSWKMPPGRPIVSDCDSESYNISLYIDTFLQPLVALHGHLLRDSYDFVQRVRGLVIPTGAFLVTGDITALYTNMHIDRIISTIKELFAASPDPCRPDDILLELLHFTLTHNDFQFNGRSFLQILGTAMGKRYAPSLANLYLLYFDRAFLGDYRICPLCYFRFIDDIFMVWVGTLMELREFNRYVNSLIPDISIALVPGLGEVPFLDVCVFDTGGEGLQTKVHFKPTDTHQLLDVTLFHPPHTCKGVLKSQLIRLARISSFVEDYSKSCDILYASLSIRGYSSRYFRTLKAHIWRSWHHRIGCGWAPDRRRSPFLPMVLPYSPFSSRLARGWKAIVRRNTKFNGVRLITAFTNHKNLRNHLSRSKLGRLATSGNVA